MKKNYIDRKLFSTCLLLVLTISSTVFSQVGIGTVTPSASSVLELSSTTQGMLTPRMTTVQRSAIISPADGLLVYDTDLKSFYHFVSSTSSWSKVSNEANGRSNFKRIKTASDLATELSNGGGTKYLLTTNTYYEVNGTILLSFPIDLNEAYISGLDANEDKLIRTSGNLFDGSKGGTIRNVTIVVTGGGKVFNLSASSGPTDNLIIRDAIIANSSNVGTVTNFSLVFASIVQFSGNLTGIVYNNITKLLLSNVAWFGNNAGTFERFEGTYGLLEKTGGFTEVPSGAFGFDVSSNPTITGDAVMESVVFLGAGQYVRPYTVGTYIGYNFNDSWTVRSTGIPTEGDAFATGNLYLDRVPASPTIQLTTIGTPYKIPGATISTNLYRISSATNNRLVYLGKKTRTFSILASLSFEAGSGATDVLFYFTKFGAGGTPITYITSSQTFIDSNTSNVQSLSVSGTVSLANGEYIELYAQRINGSNKTFTIRSYNVSMK